MYFSVFNSISTISRYTFDKYYHWTIDIYIQIYICIYKDIYKYVGQREWETRISIFSYFWFTNQIISICAYGQQQQREDRPWLIRIWAINWLQQRHTTNIINTKFQSRTEPNMLQQMRWYYRRRFITIKVFKVMRTRRSLRSSQSRRAMRGNLLHSAQSYGIQSVHVCGGQRPPTP